MMQERVKPPLVKPSDNQGIEQLLRLELLTLHEDLRTRTILDQHVCAQWTPRMRAQRDGRVFDARGQIWPSLIVVSDGQTHWLVDGLHRVAAARGAGITSFQCVVFSGELRDAQERALSANLLSERKRTNEDKRLVVRRALLDVVWRTLSDARLAELCGVSQPFVSKLRRELLAAGEITQLAERLGADGRVYQAAKISGRTPGIPRAKLTAPSRPSENKKYQPRPARAVSAPPAPAIEPTPPIIRKREPAQNTPASAPASPDAHTIWLQGAPTAAALRATGLDPGSLRLLVAPSLERRHWYDVANDGVPLLARLDGVLVVPQTRDLPHAVSHLIRQNIAYIGLATLQDGSAWHLWGLDESLEIPAAHDLPELCAALNPLAAPWLVYTP
jgi:hypothetical protein